MCVCRRQGRTVSRVLATALCRDRRAALTHAGTDVIPHPVNPAPPCSACAVTAPSTSCSYVVVTGLLQTNKNVKLNSPAATSVTKM